MPGNTITAISSPSTPNRHEFSFTLDIQIIHSHATATDLRPNYLAEYDLYENNEIIKTRRLIREQLLCETQFCLKRLISFRIIIKTLEKKTKICTVIVVRSFKALEPQNARQCSLARKPRDPVLLTTKPELNIQIIRRDKIAKLSDQRNRKKDWFGYILNNPVCSPCVHVWIFLNKNQSKIKNYQFREQFLLISIDYIKCINFFQLVSPASFKRPLDKYVWSVLCK